MRKKRIILIVLAALVLLMIPLVAMQFTDEVVWTLFDFVFAGGLFIGTGLTYEFVSSKINVTTYRAAVGVAVITALLLIWINGAVGIIGDDNPVNLLYGGVLVVGLIGAALANLKPLGMAVTLLAMAFAQMVVPVIGLIFWNPQDYSWSPGVLRVFILNGFFAIMFALSAILFRNASGITERKV